MGILSEPRVIAEFCDYPGFVEALRARARELQIAVSDDANLAIMGLPSNYLSKLLRPKPVRRIGPHSMGPILGGFAVKLVMVEDEAALRRLRMLSEKYGKGLKIRNDKLVRSGATYRLRYMRKLASKGGTTRAQRLTPAERSASARAAVMVRWRKPKKTVRI